MTRIQEKRPMANPPRNQATRRDVLAAVAAGSAVVGLPLVTAEAERAQEPPKPAGEKLKVVVVGGHPDDPEATTGGTIARYTDLGHEVICIYLTRGEAGFPDKSAEEAAEIRSAEAATACSILNARPPVFVGQIDGRTELNATRYDEFFELLNKENPDVVFTHWPVDGHRDHRVASLLVYDAWRRGGKKFALYYFEILAGADTQLFRPTHYVDITTTEERKRQACYAHSHAVRFYPKFHELMTRFRGLECGCAFAEAFVHHNQGPGGRLP
jgi:LmbE family N-acetylglucosaminyl deacetylase